MSIVLLFARLILHQIMFIRFVVLLLLTLLLISSIGALISFLLIWKVVICLLNNKLFFGASKLFIKRLSDMSDEQLYNILYAAYEQNGIFLDKEAADLEFTPIIQIIKHHPHLLSDSVVDTIFKGVD